MSMYDDEEQHKGLNKSKRINFGTENLKLCLGLVFTLRALRS